MSETAEEPSRTELSMHFAERDLLYRSYMPFVQNGGLFIRTEQPYEAGEQVQLQVTLPETADSFHISGQVIWITPAAITGVHVPGVGVQFDGEDSGRLQARIENILAGFLETARPTFTM